MPREHKKVIYLDGHTDTVQALRAQWREKLGGGVDAYDGLVDGGRLDPGVLRASSATSRPTREWEHLVFGRGSADQLAGVVAQIVATKILLELAPRGRAARGDRPLLRDGGRGGQRRRRADVRHAPTCCRAPRRAWSPTS